MKWIEDDDIFIPIKRKEYKVILSVDISEGLGQDYSVINIFKINSKTFVRIFRPDIINLCGDKIS